MFDTWYASNTPRNVSTQTPSPQRNHLTRHIYTPAVRLSLLVVCVQCTSIDPHIFLVQEVHILVIFWSHFLKGLLLAYLTF
jgi:hypothetical protein